MLTIDEIKEVYDRLMNEVKANFEIASPSGKVAYASYSAGLSVFYAELFDADNEKSQ